MQGPETTISARLQIIEAAIAAACESAGRRREDVQLIAVSKTHPPAEVIEAINAGVRNLGENRLEEVHTKIPAVADRQPARTRFTLNPFGMKHFAGS